MAVVKLRCIMGCPGLKNSYWEKGLLIDINKGSNFQKSFEHLEDWG